MQTQKLAKIILKMQDSKDISISIANFLSVVKKNKLEYLLPSLSKLLGKIKRDEDEKNVEKIISPFLLEDSTEKEIKSKYNLHNTKQVIDKKIIAGFKIYTKNKIVDASLNTILKKFNTKK